MRALCLVPMFVLSLSCGYRFVALQDKLSEGVKRVNIPTFSNRTHEAGLENVFTSALRNEFFNSQIIEVVSADEAEAQIVGTITGVSYESMAHSERDLSGRSKKILANEYRAKADITIELIRKSDKKMIWQKTFSDSRQYTTSDDLLKNEVKQQEALKKVALYLMEQAHDMMLEDF